ncbi:MAG: YbjN domain-containing protein [Acidobacteria bacterium]|nr:YbjN domain-containing protein [Acidobacteriota bacterium]
MNRDWRSFCRVKDMSLDGNDIVVSFANGRSHRVTVVTESDELVVSARVLPPSIVSGLDRILETIWRRNRATPLLGFRIDRRGWVVGEATVSTVGLSAAEFRTYVRAVAAESDRFEHAITGRDRL